MIRKLQICTLFILALATGCSQDPAVSRTNAGEAQLPELLPLQLLLAPPEYLAPQISPDGQWLSYIAPLDDVPNLFVAPIEHPAAGHAITHYSDRGVQATDVSGVVMYRWHADSKQILYPKDYDGDENWDIHIVDVASGEDINLTPSPGIKNQLIAYHPSNPNHAVVQVGEIHPLLPSLYKLNLDTGEHEQLIDNDGSVVGFIADDALVPRLSFALNDQGGLDINRLDANGSSEYFFTIAAQNMPAVTTASAQKINRFDEDNKFFYTYDVEGRDTAALSRLNMASGEKELVAQDDRVDLAGVLYHPATNAPLAYATNWTRTSWHAIDDSVELDITYLNDHTAGDWTVVSQSMNNNRWIVRDMLSHKPVRYFVYDRGAKTTGQLFTETPALEGLALSKMYPYIVTTEDGLELVSYLLLPPWTDVDEDGRPAEPVPTVVLVHGGPSDERAQFAYAPFVHWLANRGYAVMYVNFRGSAGFGKAYMNGQTREWGGKMHQDILDQVQWAIAEKVAIADKVAILGGSYGGYEVLVAMTMTPDVFACGIDLVGPSNLEVFMPHWDEDRMGTIIGDPRTVEGREFLRSRSPINFAHQTTHPVLIGQGANDSRVPQEQSDSVVEAMRDNNAAVTYALYPDEGHGLMRTANNNSFWAISEVFLAGCLGGRSLPIGDALVGASVQVPVGAEHIAGLTQALRGN